MFNPKEWLEQNQDKNWGYILFVALIAVFVIIKIFPSHVLILNKPIKMTIFHNNGQIINIHSPRDVKREETFSIDVIDFKPAFVLTHSRLGNFGATHNFFADFRVGFRVKKNGKYTFIVESDDGYLLTLNGKEITKFEGPRGMGELTEGVARLSDEGLYKLKLSYYQGDGELGLRAYYQYQGDSKRYLIGEDSEYLRFECLDCK